MLRIGFSEWPPTSRQKHVFRDVSWAEENRLMLGRDLPFYTLKDPNK